jgi:hypothetical protein
MVVRGLHINQFSGAGKNSNCMFFRMFNRNDCSSMAATDLPLDCFIHGQATFNHMLWKRKLKKKDLMLI